MATLAEAPSVETKRRDHLSGTSRDGTIDRWIYVFTVASFLAITLAGFIPDSFAKVAAVQSGLRPPFPLILHVHAVLMGSFLVLLLIQTLLVARGNTELHQRLGIAAFLIAPAIVLAGFILVPTMYGYAWHAAQAASPQDQAKLRSIVFVHDDIMLLQLRIGFLFPLFLSMALLARTRNASFHKRMVILATAMVLPAAIDRMSWLPSTLPSSPVAADLYMLLAVSPMFLWDVFRNRMIHPAYLVWIGINLPVALAVYGL